MRQVAVVGVGMTRFGKFPETPVERFGRQAVWDLSLIHISEPTRPY